MQKVKDKGYQDGILELQADKTATLLDTAGKVRAAVQCSEAYESPLTHVLVMPCNTMLAEGTARKEGMFPGLQVVTKGKAKVPSVLESGAIVELGNFCCEYDQEVPLEDFK